MNRIIRATVLAALLWGTIGMTAPTPADATAAGTVEFEGWMTVGPHGIAYPFIDNSQAPSANNPTLHLSSHKLPPHISNSAVIENFGTSFCEGTLAAVNKSTPTKAEAGNCVMFPYTPGSAGTVHGYCGWMDGQLSLALRWSTFSYSLHLSFMTVNGEEVVTGHWHKHGTTHSGTVTGVMEVVPDTAGLAGAGTGSCLSKARKTFLVSGSLELISTTSATPTSLPRQSFPRISTPLSTSVSFGL